METEERYKQFDRMGGTLSICCPMESSHFYQNVFYHGVQTHHIGPKGDGILSTVETVQWWY